MDRWTGKTAVVTGASTGIGAAIVLQLADAGINVVGLARRSEKVKALIPKVKGKGKIIPLKCDVSNPEDISKVFADIKKQIGGIDILVNNAGVAREGKIIDTPLDDVRAIIDTNFLGLVVCSQEAIKSMDERNVAGHIVNINSLAGHGVPNPEYNVSVYSPSKWAVTVTTAILRNEFARRNSPNKIKITSLSPGLVKTDIFEASGMTSMTDEVLNSTPHLKSEDVASSVLYVLGTPPHVDIAELTIRPVGDFY